VFTHPFADPDPDLSLQLACITNVKRVVHAHARFLKTRNFQS